jgi:hypothetical protein
MDLMADKKRHNGVGCSLATAFGFLPFLLGAFVLCVLRNELVFALHQHTPSKVRAALLIVRVVVRTYADLQLAERRVRSALVPILMAGGQAVIGQSLFAEVFRS